MYPLVSHTVILLDTYVYGGFMIDSMMETTKVRYILDLNFSLQKAR